MKIKVIIPNSGMDRKTLDSREEMLSAYAWPGTEISVDCIPGGPESIESAYDEVLASPYVVEMSLQAEKEGFDKNGFRVIVNCGEDGGQVVMHIHFHVLAGKDLGEKIVG